VDSNILNHPEAMVIGLISIQEEVIGLIPLAPANFWKWAHIIMKSLAVKLAQHNPNNHVIDNLNHLLGYKSYFFPRHLAED
jgi:hypothetical protein